MDLFIPQAVQSISIQPLLRFILGNLLRLALSGSNFNTTLVKVHLRHNVLRHLTYNYFNTTLVKVHLALKLLTEEAKQNFNTTLVKVHRTRARREHFNDIISIQPLLRFIFETFYRPPCFSAISIQPLLRFIRYLEQR